MPTVTKSFQGFLLATSLLWLLWARIGPSEVMAPDGFPFRNIVTGLAYASLQEAINANETLDGHTITVNAGIYDGCAFAINKSVSIVGESRETTILRGFVSYEFGIFFVSADNVTIAGFTLRDGYRGIVLAGNYAHIANCTVCNTTYGIFSGIFITFGGNTIEGNIIRDNEEIGIELMTSNDSICNNNITGNRIGIYLVSIEEETSGAVISGNTIENNQLGCQIALSHDNAVFHNNFLNNKIQASIPTGDANKWDDGYPSGGNYWSDYNGTDADHDGIGDSPFIIDTNNQDSYPLMVEYVIPEYPMGPTIALFTIASLVTVAIRKKKKRPCSSAENY